MAQELARAVFHLRTERTPTILTKEFGDDGEWDYWLDDSEPEGDEEPKFFVYHHSLYKTQFSLHAVYGPKADHPDCTWIDETYVGAKGKAGIPSLVNIDCFSASFLQKHIHVLLRLCNYPLPAAGVPEAVRAGVTTHLTNLLLAKDKFVPSKGDQEAESLATRISYLLQNSPAPLDLNYLLYDKVGVEAELQEIEDEEEKMSLEAAMLCYQNRDVVLCIVPDEHFPSSLFWTPRANRMRVLSGYPEPETRALRNYIAGLAPVGDNIVGSVTVVLVSYHEMLFEELFPSDDQIVHNHTMGLDEYDAAWGRPALARDIRLDIFASDEMYHEEVNLQLITESRECIDLLEDDLLGNIFPQDTFTEEEYSQLIFFAKYLYQNQALVDKYERVLREMDGMNDA